jgi:PST family polysaccharide transporter
VLWVQIIWFVGLIPAVILGTHAAGVAGAAWAHVVISVIFVLPAYAFGLRRLGIPVPALLGTLWLPIVACVPTWWLAHVVVTNVSSPLLALLIGGSVATLAYAAVVYRYVRRLLPRRERNPAARLEQQTPVEAVA